MKHGAQPTPLSWREKPFKLTEPLESYVQRQKQNHDFFDSVEHSEVWWQSRWLRNQLESAGELHIKNLDKRKRVENAQKIWELGRQYCWKDSPVSFAIFEHILDLVGLKITEHN